MSPSPRGRGRGRGMPFLKESSSTMLALLLALLLFAGVARGQLDSCSIDAPGLCTDQCTLDGQRESPCRFECDPATGECSDICAIYFVETAIAIDEFDPFCSARKALMERDAIVIDGRDAAFYIRALMCFRCSSPAQLG